MNKTEAHALLTEVRAGRFPTASEATIASALRITGDAVGGHGVETADDARAPARFDAANPWGLTERQAQTMDSLCRTGCFKLAARDLGIGVRSVEINMQRVNEKIPGANRVQKILAWDRWRRGGAA
jgi:FixJ family two-component response regulator